MIVKSKKNKLWLSKAKKINDCQSKKLMIVKESKKKMDGYKRKRKAVTKYI